MQQTKYKFNLKLGRTDITAHCNLIPDPSKKLLHRIRNVVTNGLGYERSAHYEDTSEGLQNHLRDMDKRVENSRESPLQLGEIFLETKKESPDPYGIERLCEIFDAPGGYSRIKSLSLIPNLL